MDRTRIRSEPALDRRTQLARRYQTVRRATLELCSTLSPEDAGAQSMPDASPAKWHLAHTTWFFETFVLARARADHRPFHARFDYLFNSYYDTVGERHPRSERGLLTRPDLAQVHAWRAHVDSALLDWLAAAEAVRDAAYLDVLELGLNHEQQHQELLLTDVLHLFSRNPLEPALRAEAQAPPAMPASELEFVRYPAGLRSLGHAGMHFAFDNEGPAHPAHVAAFELAARPVTCGEYLEFIEAGGYREPRWWLSDGWQFVREQGLTAPLYWHSEAGAWSLFGLTGRRALDAHEPVAHISCFEADAYARFRDARLPREAEWETAAREVEIRGNFVESGALHPLPVACASSSAPAALFGDVWEWTQSAYSAYPGYRPAAGALGEYNGKFMANQMVLRGGSCASPADHLRASYRNFFPPTARGQFSGLRLARDA